MSEHLAIYRLRDELLASKKVSVAMVGRFALIVGYASHNWLFCTSAESARAMHWYGRIYCVETARDALRMMGAA
jgi:hypothetical protein